MTMMTSKFQDLQGKFNRKKHNREIVQRMKSGETLHRYNAQSSWFPPRPIIKKDEEAIKSLYGHSEKQKD